MRGHEIEQLIKLLGRLPGFGPRSARRIALHLLREPQARLVPLARALDHAAQAVKTCTTCGNLDTSDPCHICTDPVRDRSVVCVVETVGDLWALERAGVHRGVYLRWRVSGRKTSILLLCLTGLSAAACERLFWPLAQRLKAQPPCIGLWTSSASTKGLP